MASKLEFEQVTKALEGATKALTVSEIKKQTGLTLDDRTLLRRINKLISQEVIEKTGKNKGTAYKLIAFRQVNEDPADAALIPLSEDGENLLALINQPQISRTPVGYSRQFWRPMFLTITVIYQGLKNNN